MDIGTFRTGVAMIVFMFTIAFCTPAATTSSTPTSLHKTVAPTASTQPATRSAPTLAQASVIVAAIPSATQLHVGDTLTMTVSTQLTNPQQCQYPLYDVSLATVPSSSQLVRFESPARIGPPGPNPAVFRLTAVAAGVIQIQGVAYGEENCGAGWQWATFSNTTPEITILPATTWYLPMVVAS